MHTPEQDMEDDFARRKLLLEQRSEAVSRATHLGGRRTPTRILGNGQAQLNVDRRQYRRNATVVSSRRPVLMSGNE